MFRSSTNIREIALNLTKVIFPLKHSVNQRLCGCVAACCLTTIINLKNTLKFTLKYT